MKNDGNTLTIVGMLLTVVLSIGGTWVSNIVSTNINDTHIQQLLTEGSENKRMHAKVHTNSSQIISIKEKQNATTAHLLVLDTKVGAVEVDAARSATAIENLVIATQQLTETNKQLIIAVAKLER